MNGTTSVNFLSLLTFCSHFLTGLRVFESDEGFVFAPPPRKKRTCEHKSIMTLNTRAELPVIFRLVSSAVRSQILIRDPC